MTKQGQREGMQSRARVSRLCRVVWEGLTMTSIQRKNSLEPKAQSKSIPDTLQSLLGRKKVIYDG